MQRIGMTGLFGNNLRIQTPRGVEPSIPVVTPGFRKVCGNVTQTATSSKSTFYHGGKFMPMFTSVANRPTVAG